MSKPLSKEATQALIAAVGIDNLRLEVWSGTNGAYNLIQPQGGSKPKKLGRVRASIMRWYQCKETKDGAYHTAPNVSYYKLEISR